MLTDQTHSTQTARYPAKPILRRRPDIHRIISEIEHLCAGLAVGDRLPKHTDLMRELNSSERTVLRALDELQRKGRIVRRHGSGTFIASPMPPPLIQQPHTKMKAIVAIAKPDHSFFDYAIEQLYKHARDADLNLFCCLIGNEDDQESILSGIGPAEGYLVFSQNYAPLAQRLADRGSNVVMIGSPPVNMVPTVPYVCGDQERGGYLAVKHLIDLGHRRLLYLVVGSNYPTTSRWRGMQLAISRAAKAGLAVTIDVSNTDTVKLWQRDQNATRSLFQRPDGPTGILVWNDHEAVDVLSALKNAGLSVPGDVSVIGYDALPDAAKLSPSLTTVDGAINEQLIGALRLLSRPTPVPPTYAMVALPTLLIKESTAPPAGVR